MYLFNHDKLVTGSAFESWCILIDTFNEGTSRKELFEKPELKKPNSSVSQFLISIGIIHVLCNSAFKFKVSVDYYIVFSIYLLHSTRS
jgi:hypothetical protein